jgi:hypothetical protein
MDGSLDSFMHSVWTRFGFYYDVGKENFVVLTMHESVMDLAPFTKNLFTNQTQFLSCFFNLSLGLVSMWPTIPTIIW